MIHVQSVYTYIILLFFRESLALEKYHNKISVHRRLHMYLDYKLIHLLTTLYTRMNIRRSLHIHNMNIHRSLYWQKGNVILCVPNTTRNTLKRGILC